MTIRGALQDLGHDLGKHLARTARNVRGALPDALRPLLLKDLYALDGRRPASAVFAEHRAILEPTIRDARLDAIADKLARVDALRSALEAGDADAATEAIALALEVAGLAREIAATRIEDAP